MGERRLGNDFDGYEDHIVMSRYFDSQKTLGNVQVSDDYLGAPEDIDVPAQDTVELQAAWREWATECQASGTPTIVQLNHPGRQSPAGAGKKSFFTKNLAPSPIGLNFGSGILAKVASKVLFGTPKEMTVQDIELVIDQFVEGAKRSYDAGFKGVELHAAYVFISSLPPACSNNLLDMDIF
jgi:2,4-dienoyl-CoA reductase-like NADH-dependent reductase (Old Yellow Enzyme family)